MPKKTIIRVNEKVLATFEHLDETVAGEDYDENEELEKIPIHEYMIAQAMSNALYDGVSSKYKLTTEVVEE